MAGIARSAARLFATVSTVSREPAISSVGTVVDAIVPWAAVPARDSTARTRASWAPISPAVLPPNECPATPIRRRS